MSTLRILLVPNLLFMYLFVKNFVLLLRVPPKGNSTQHIDLFHNLAEIGFRKETFLHFVLINTQADKDNECFLMCYFMHFDPVSSRI